MGSSRKNVLVYACLHSRSHGEHLTRYTIYELLSHYVFKIPEHGINGLVPYSNNPSPRSIFSQVRLGLDMVIEARDIWILMEDHCRNLEGV